MASFLQNGNESDTSNGHQREIKNKHRKGQSAINCAARHQMFTYPGTDQQPSGLHGLPRLSQALKSFKMISFLPTSHSTKNKPAFVDADDVIYYSNKEDFSQQKKLKRSSESTKSIGILPASVREKSSNYQRSRPSLTATLSLADFEQAERQESKTIQDPDAPNGVIEHNIHPKECPQPTTSSYYRRNALDEIRQFYKSTPNFSTLEGDSSDYNICEEDSEYSNSIHSPNCEADNCNPMRLSSTSIHSPIQTHNPTQANSGHDNRLLMGARAIHDHHMRNFLQDRRRLPPPKTCSNFSTAASSSSTASSSAAGGHGMLADSPTDSGYISRRQTPRHMTVSLKNLNLVSGISSPVRKEPTIQSPITPTGKLVNLYCQPEKRKSQRIRKYVWTDYRRLMDSYFPFSDKDVLQIVHKHSDQIAKLYPTESSDAFNDSLSSIAIELTDLMKEILAKICVETSRFSCHLLKCTSNDICSAIRLIFPEVLAENCMKAGMQATTLYGLGGCGAGVLRHSMSSRAGLKLDVGRFYRWMVDSQICAVLTDSSVVYLAAVMECALTEGIKFLYHMNDETASESYHKLKSFYQRQQNTKHGNIFCVKSLDELQSKVYDVINSADISGKKQVGSDIRPYFDHKFKPFEWDNSALIALFYYVRCKGNEDCTCSKEREISLYQWIETIYIHTTQRFGIRITENDVLQAARQNVLNFDCPPCSTKHALSEIDTNSGFNQFSKAILTANEDEKEIFLLNGSVIIDAPVQHMRGIQTTLTDNGGNPLIEFGGWTPLCWAVALEDIITVEHLLRGLAKPHDCFMVRESPIQIGATTGNIQLCSILLKATADPFYSTINYNGMNMDYRGVGAPSALSLSVIYGQEDLFEELLRLVECVNTNNSEY
ncbi:ankyrin repeat and BTB/POZ domain-containing protein BTBD11-B [Ditylenchus destructor]|uniref:Ankyrin repeat and BTB/POZ domain-containing protein BTBD11-B n=1 Tax=Ditylenchus destructor TaxID=166010 RepID=A0AAD4NHL9_9BILA|nr:ankyrin repeat and BTB/POZ domain-containing protein BTBD11-B [Ditylenchus destructor]